MIRAVVLLLAAVLTLAGCGGGGPGGDQAASATTDAPKVDPEDYADQVIEAFRATYPTNPEYEGDRGDASDWAAFVAVISKLEPPEGQELAHERMATAFEAYVQADVEAEDVCAEHPGPGGPCYVAVREASEKWSAALDRAYQLPGLSWDSLLG
jgi:hypothetical protein